MKHRAMAVALLLAAHSSSAFAQPPLPASYRLLAGTRVRVTAPSFGGRLEGRLLSQEGGFLVVEVDGRLPVRVPREAIARVEVSTARKRHTLQGLLIGAAALGGLMAASANVVEGCGATDTSCFASRGEAFAGGALIGGLVGALVGRGRVSDQWQPVGLHGAGLSITPVPGRGAGFALSVSF